MECTICYEPILYSNFAMLDGIGESGYYHTICLQTWVRKSRVGCLTGLTNFSYTIYNHGVPQITIPIVKNEETIMEELADCWDTLCTII